MQSSGRLICGSAARSIGRREKLVRRKHPPSLGGASLEDIEHALIALMLFNRNQIEAKLFEAYACQVVEMYSHP